MTRTRPAWPTIPLPHPVVVTPDEMEDEDPTWAWTSERQDETA